jgi:hypothetical protein
VTNANSSYQPRTSKMLTEAGDVVYVVDEGTGSMINIDVAHHEIHEGCSFLASDAATAVTTRDYLLITPAVGIVHLICEFAADSKVSVVIYRAPTATAGTAMPVVNRNHLSALTSGVSVSHTPTGVTAGTDIVDRFLVGSGERSGSLVRADAEHVLAPSTKYLIRLTGTNVQINTRLLWYEVA